MEDCSIYIESPHKLQCKLLIDFFSNTVDIPCYEIPAHHDSVIARQTLYTLILSDYDGCSDELSDLHTLSKINQRYSQTRAYTAIFNTPERYTNEYDLIINGFNGLFYQGVSLNQLSTGVKSILSGELWFSRAATSMVIRHKFPPQNTSASLTKTLTPREKQILLDIANGSNNDKIAAQRFLSRFTVKTHIQNIYKKINVKNRSQATHWAFQNRLHLSPPKVLEKE